jgi:hypothetical protein
MFMLFVDRESNHKRTSVEVSYSPVRSVRTLRAGQSHTHKKESRPIRNAPYNQKLPGSLMLGRGLGATGRA